MTLRQAASRPGWHLEILTRKRLHESGLLPPQLIVDDPDILPQVVADVIAHRRDA